MAPGAILPEQRRDLRGDWRDGSASGTCPGNGDVDRRQQSQQQCDAFERGFHSVLSYSGSCSQLSGSPVW